MNLDIPLIVGWHADCDVASDSPDVVYVQQASIPEPESESESSSSEEEEEEEDDD